MHVHFLYKCMHFLPDQYIATRPNLFSVLAGVAADWALEEAQDLLDQRGRTEYWCIFTAKSEDFVLGRHCISLCC